METLTLYELNLKVRRVITLNFGQSSWVTAEISQARNSRGHWYIELIQKDDTSTELKAQASCVLWSGTYTQLRNKYKDLITNILEEGVQVKVLVKVDFHERYGLKYVIEDVDPTYTMGQLELQRRETLLRLEHEKLIDKNNEKILPIVIKKIAVISSKTAAGLQDFIQQLQNNIYGYTYEIVVFEAAMQGTNTEPEVVAQLQKITNKYDCVVIIRGGGSKIDLSAFDSYLIGKSIANSPIPVITGIGHDIDTSVADIVANQSLKTPTAVAEFLIQHNLRFEEQNYRLLNELSIWSKEKINESNIHMESNTIRLHQLSTSKIQKEKHNLDNQKSLLHILSNNLIFQSKNKLETLMGNVLFLDPKHSLERGFSITRIENKTLKSIRDITLQKKIQTYLIDGMIESEIINTNGK